MNSTYCCYRDLYKYKHTFMFSVRFITKCCVNVSNEKNSNNLCTKFINKIKVSKYSYKLINVSVLFSCGINRKSEYDRQ